MQATNGLGVILENRFYGQSYPFNNSSTDNLRYLTNEQSQSSPINSKETNAVNFGLIVLVLTR